MATTKNKLGELTVKELEAKLRDLKEEAFNLRLQQTTGQLENSLQDPHRPSRYRTCDDLPESPP